MTYNPNIPQATDRPSVSQGQILTNFLQIEDVFGQNHVEFDDVVVNNRGRVVSSPGTPNGGFSLFFSSRVWGAWSVSIRSI